MSSFEIGGLEFEPSAGPVSKHLSLRDVPWQWRDLVFALLPFILLQGVSALLKALPPGSLPSWVWIPATAFGMFWMFSYPLWVASRRGGVPGLPPVSTIAINGLLALVVLPAIFFTVVTTVLVLLAVFGQSALGTSPIQSILLSHSRFEVVVLIVFASVIAPLAEEIFFRGMFYNALRQR